MFLVEMALQRRTLTMVLTFAMMFAGFQAFLGLGRLEDPEFTIKTAVVMTDYPGATAEEVEEELTERLEAAIQKLGEVDDVKSISRPGQSIIVVDLKDTTPQRQIPQVWDELRRKVADAGPGLPPGATSPRVLDDYGDVFGAFFAVTGDGYSLEELKNIVDDMRTELLTVPGVASVETWGAPIETVEVEMTRSKLAELGMTPAAIFQTLARETSVTSAGQVHTGELDLRVVLEGSPRSLDDLRALIVRGRSEGLVRLGDVAQVRYGILDRPGQIMFFDGQPAVGIGASTVEGGNVVDTGERVGAKLRELKPRLPLGVEVIPVSFQADTVDEAVNAFVVNLVEAIAIVVGLLLVFMGLRSGLLIGGVLLMTIVGSFVFMGMFDVSLQRISLGALIIALGMLVDNAIVVVEGMLVRIDRGVNPEQAARESVSETMWPLLGATIVAILAFAAISLSPDSAGEFLASLFQVIAISLLLSWVLAVTVTPLLGVLFLKPTRGMDSDPYGGAFFQSYRRWLGAMIRHRFLTIAIVGGLLVSSFVGFGFVKQNFFPDSSRPQFMVQIWRPEGGHIRDTSKDAEHVAEFARTLDGVTHAVSFAGSGALRFILTYEAELPNPNYAQVLVSVDDHNRIDDLQREIRAWSKEGLPGAELRTKRFVIGAGGGAKIEARYSGPDPRVLRELGEKAREVMLDAPELMDVRQDWRSRVPVLSVPLRSASARLAGVTREEIAQSLALSSSGITVGLHRRGEDLLPVRLQVADLGESTAVVGEATVWSSASGRALPVRQVVGEAALDLHEGLIRRRNRVRTLTVQAEPSRGVASAAFAAIRPRIEALELPPGYQLEWGGEYESSGEANGMLLANVPLFLALMFIIVVGLFDAIRTPVIVFSTLPLALIGVTVGLLVFDKPFGFVALLGFLSLSGMLIKNAIVLIEQININLAEGQPAFDAVVEAGVTRVRPVAMAAFTTVLGMIPLVSDVFFGALAVTIMGGLTFATVLTLLVVPVLYATAYRVKAPTPTK